MLPRWQFQQCSLVSTPELAQMQPPRGQSRTDLQGMLGLTLPELIIASNAAVLGATTAPALAATKGWRDLVTPGVLVGVLGYALGTFLGTLVFKYWGAIL